MDTERLFLSKPAGSAAGRRLSRAVEKTLPCEMIVKLCAVTFSPKDMTKAVERLWEKHAPKRRSGLKIEHAAGSAKARTAHMAYELAMDASEGNMELALDFEDLFSKTLFDWQVAVFSGRNLSAFAGISPYYQKAAVYSALLERDALMIEGDQESAGSVEDAGMELSRASVDDMAGESMNAFLKYLFSPKEKGLKASDLKEARRYEQGAVSGQSIYTAFRDILRDEDLDTGRSRREYELLRFLLADKGILFDGLLSESKITRKDVTSLAKCIQLLSPEDEAEEKALKAAGWTGIALADRIQSLTRENEKLKRKAAKPGKKEKAGRRDSEGRRMAELEKRAEKAENENARLKGEYRNGLESEIVALERKLADREARIAELEKLAEKARFPQETDEEYVPAARATEEVILTRGKVPDYWPGEVHETVMDALERASKNAKDGTRRKEILEDILAANPYAREISRRRNLVKTLLTGQKKGLEVQKERKLRELGFEIIPGKVHSKLCYHGDPRYATPMAGTGSDTKGGSNLAARVNLMIH